MGPEDEAMPDMGWSPETKIMSIQNIKINSVQTDLSSGFHPPSSIFPFPIIAGISEYRNLGAYTTNLDYFSFYPLYTSTYEIIKTRT